MTTNERHHRPHNAWLEDWRTHCEQIHGATSDDYGMQVVAWHKRNHPDCLTTPTLRGRRY